MVQLSLFTQSATEACYSEENMSSSQSPLRPMSGKRGNDEDFAFAGGELPLKDPRTFPGELDHIYHRLVIQTLRSGEALLAPGASTCPLNSLPHH